ncbi:MAG: hypothetical protein A2268_14975 [Candidatus Raymondbacteria bacterium RifOxyA12_full_50_37]|nr:MAG: hypothetical protein A2268_14975 [Candidatus Raymondbacteria bacterium RifOxyA12_full_50_37]OGJ88537.1 MAG: hypothetical protein A2248_20285 [Candidatus Raymondbacteria bacterium RIFOXYA2_FULL_49_16]OGJ98998.1 MAG: hypothetical protein A2453_11005 [Candidatus Raymondbacteria bacterium RIFOXYC2_FULL_50_21]OGK00634.1 MAG: hypothetical protein A2487_13850 [Candidatus Raymondbacteria bacterium RifOxyC12_full_50_8]OGP41508.1 MAG: hypothetical protein A2324_05815 [Candidatus Raymondbacteria b
MQPTSQICRLLAVGDIMLHGKIGKAIETGTDPFAPVAPLLQKKHLLFGNLETLASKARVPHNASAGKYVCPDSAIPLLKKHGFNIVNLGHNHLYDWGNEGVEHTMALLKEAGIAFGGAGKSPEEAGRPVYVTCPGCGLKYAFLCFTGTYNTTSAKNGYLGCPPDHKCVPGLFAEAKRNADIIVASIHGGTCMNEWPAPDMLKACRKAADLGAMVVLGHHAHVFNGIQEYGKSLIAYALPDFVRPMPFDDDELPKGMVHDSHDSFILEVDIAKDKIPNWQIYPCEFDDRPETRPAGKEAEKRSVERVLELSKDISEEKSGQKYLEAATSNFHETYTKNLWKSFRRGGLKWFMQRLMTLKPHHVSILFSGFFKAIKRNAKP